jgi:DNA mismatch endonuclease (patch repair protein)
MAVQRRASGQERAKRPDIGTGKRPISSPVKPRESYSSHRSWTMAQIRSKNTTPEMNVRRAAHSLGLRFRLHRSDLPGKPDLVFRRWRTALFVNGCFWHSHHCERARRPKTNVDYWTRKLRRNALRDKEAVRLLRRSGWRCAVIWECQAKDPAKLDRILRRLFVSDRRS